MPAPTPSPPFTRLTAPDPATNRVVQDLYDKLNVVAQAGMMAPATAASPAPPASPATPTLRKITSGSTLRPGDQIVSAVLTNPASLLLPHTSTVRGRGPFTIQNASNSGGSLSLASAPGELVNGAAASSYTLAAGKSITLVPNPGSWLIVNRIP